MVAGFYFILFSSYCLEFNVGTKLKREITEQATVFHALKRGWLVLKAVGNPLTYDLVFHIKEL